MLLALEPPKPENAPELLSQLLVRNGWALLNIPFLSS